MSFQFNDLRTNRDFFQQRGEISNHSDSNLFSLSLTSWLAPEKESYLRHLGITKKSNAFKFLLSEEKINDQLINFLKVALVQED